jgi:hypothetical protein
MASAEVESATHVIEEAVGGVSEPVLPVEATVAGVDDKVAEVINGAQINIS